MRFLAPFKDKVGLHYSHDAHHARYAGLAHCDSVWDCPICQERISTFRSQELMAALALARQEKNIGFVMVTFTLRHAAAHTLAELRSALSKALRELKSGKPWQTIKTLFGVVGTIRAIEVTYSRRNGWHIHCHMGLVLQSPLTEKGVKRLELRVRQRYNACLKKTGFDASWRHGVQANGDISAVETMAEYIAKNQKLPAARPKWDAVSEMTRPQNKEAHSPLKTLPGCTPFELAQMGYDGDAYSARKFIEFSQAMHGEKWLRYSPGLKDFLKIREIQDGEILASPLGSDDKLIAELDWRTQFKPILARYARAELLDVVEKSNGSLDAVNAFLARLDIPPVVLQPGIHINLASWNDGGEIETHAVNVFTVGEAKSPGRAMCQRDYRQDVPAGDKPD